MKKFILSLSVMGLLMVILCARSYAYSFSEQYKDSNLKAFLKNGNILFEQRRFKEQTAKLICINEDEQMQWEIELPWSEYGGYVLGQAKDDIIYAYRALDDQKLVTNHYSYTGNLISTYTMPKDIGVGLLVDEYIFFIKNDDLGFYDSNGIAHLISVENSGGFKSLYRAAGNKDRSVFLLSTKIDKESEYEILVLDQNQKEIWTYPLRTIGIFNAYEVNIAMASNGYVCIADFNIGEEGKFWITLIDEQGCELWTKIIEQPIGKSEWLSLIRMCDNNTIQFWGNARTTPKNTRSWKITVDYNGEIVEKCTYPEWIDFVSFTNEEPYGVLDPQGTPMLIEEKDINWIIQK